MIAIDIETTGLDPNVHQILEFAAVLEDGKSFQAIIRWEDFVINDFCLEMHKDLLPLCKEGIFLSVLGPMFRQWLQDCGQPTSNYKVVGANFAGFDAQFLKKVPEFPPWHYHVLEIGSLYFDGTRPRSLKDICPSETPHRALPDAKATMEAYLRRKGIATPVESTNEYKIKAPQHVLTTVTYHKHLNGGGMVADSAFVHKYACVQKDAYVGEDCSVGAFCVVEAGTIVPKGTVVGPNMRIKNL